MNPRPTLKSIAAIAQVAVSTVSMALKDRRNIPPATRQKIKDIAKSLGYVPDPMLSSLAAYRTSIRPATFKSVIAYVNSWPIEKSWRRNDTYAGWFHGAASQAENYGYKLEEFCLKEPGMTSSRYSQILRARQISGLLIGPLPNFRGHLNLEWKYFSSVAMGYTLARPSLNLVVHDQYNAIILAFRKIRHYGYRRIGLVLHPVYDMRVNHNWYAGYCVEQKKLKPNDQIPPLMERGFPEKAFVSWFRKHKPEVIIGLRGFQQISKMLHQLGKSIPTDVGYVDLNCESSSGLCAGINQNRMLVGKSAIDLLIGMLQRNETGTPRLPQSLLIQGEWQDGPSLLKRNQRSH